MRGEKGEAGRGGKKKCQAQGGRGEKGLGLDRVTRRPKGEEMELRK